MRLSTSSTSPSFNFQAFLDVALAEYTKRTGKDLANHPLTASLDRCCSPDDVLAIFEKQAEAFDEFRNGDPKLIKWLRPIVDVLHQLCTDEIVTSSAFIVSSVQTLYHCGRCFRSFFLTPFS
jgi:arginine/lysine/ornithine decarboxylase